MDTRDVHTRTELTDGHHVMCSLLTHVATSNVASRECCPPPTQHRTFACHPVGHITLLSLRSTAGSLNFKLRQLAPGTGIQHSDMIVAIMSGLELTDL
jgi:hypothetical protein